MATPETLIKAEEVAARLGITRRQVVRLVESRAISVVKLTPRTHRFRWSEVEAAIARLTVAPRR